MRAILLLLVAAAGCVGLPNAPASTPSDFRLDSNWSTGSLPPRYHYSSRIQLGGDGAGEVTEQLDYGGGPAHTLAFALTPAAVDALYADLRSAGLFRTRWRRDPTPSVGGSSWRLTVTADGRERRVPGSVTRSQRAARAAIGERVRAAVPAEVRAAMDAWRVAAQRERR